MPTYHATLTQDGPHWLVSFPDCPGCQTFGRSEAEALAMAADALAGWLETTAAAGEALPEPMFTGGVAVTAQVESLARRVAGAITDAECYLRDWGGYMPDYIIAERLARFVLAVAPLLEAVVVDDANRRPSPKPTDG